MILPCDWTCQEFAEATACPEATAPGLGRAAKDTATGEACQCRPFFPVGEGDSARLVKGLALERIAVVRVLTPQAVKGSGVFNLP